MPASIIITCEHGGNQIPIRFRAACAPSALATIEEAWDSGALDTALSLSQTLDVPCFSHQTSYALVDVNRSLGNEKLFSSLSQNLSDADKQIILERYYFPYRLRVESGIAMSEKPVLHISIHTLVESAFDIMLCYDGSRTLETESAKKFNELFQADNARQNFHLLDEANTNSDSFVRYLRSRFQPDEYAGLTLIINRKLTEEERLDVLLNDLVLTLNALRT